MTSEELKKLRERWTAVTQPLPWVAVVQDGNATVLDDNGMWVADYGAAPQDAVYGAEAANAVPALLSKIAALQDANRRLSDCAAVYVENALANAKHVEATAEDQRTRARAVDGIVDATKTLALIAELRAVGGGK